MSNRMFMTALAIAVFMTSCSAKGGDNDPGVLSGTGSPGIIGATASTLPGVANLPLGAPEPARLVLDGNTIDLVTNAEYFEAGCLASDPQFKMMKWSVGRSDGTNTTITANLSDNGVDNVSIYFQDVAYSFFGDMPSTGNATYTSLGDDWYGIEGKIAPLDGTMHSFTTKLKCTNAYWKAAGS